MLLSVRLM